MKRSEQAVKTFTGGFNCSQSVLSVFSDKLCLDKDVSLKIAASFGGGMRKGEVCGAVSGALMVIGLKYGHSIEGDTDTKNAVYAMTEEFIEKFEARNGSIICRKLLGYNISIEQEYTIMKEKGLFKSICPRFVTDAVEILEEMCDV